jgi:hypothetical protein
VLLALREFIDNKGCKVDSSTRHLRRSRTCILTADKAESAVSADVVYKVCNGSVVELASHRVAQEFVTPTPRTSKVCASDSVARNFSVDA